jgi:hypothetical protein
MNCHVLAISKLNFLKKIVHKTLIRTSEERHYVSAIKTNRLMLFRKAIGFHCENHTKHTNTLCEHNAEIWYLTAGGTYSNHWALKN